MVIVPSDMIALGDAYMFEVGVPATHTSWTAGLLVIYPYPSARAMGKAADRERHDGHHNVEFCDGHIEYLKVEQLCAPTEAARKRWNNDHQPHPELWHWP
jgi:hypothetical protein